MACVLLSPALSLIDSLLIYTPFFLHLHFLNPVVIRFLVSFPQAHILAITRLYRNSNTTAPCFISKNPDGATIWSYFYVSNSFKFCSYTERNMSECHKFLFGRISWITWQLGKCKNIRLLNRKWIIAKTIPNTNLISWTKKKNSCKYTEYKFNEGINKVTYT